MVEIDHSQQLIIDEREEASQELHALFGSSIIEPLTTSNIIVEQVEEPAQPQI